MAERRMFAKTITESDAFRDMPLSSQALYFHLGMDADDDGVVNRPKGVQRCIGASDDDLKLLIAKKFVVPFDSGIVVIKHWKMNNYIQKDRYKPSVYKEELSQLSVKENGSYSLCIQNVYSLDTQVSIDKSKNSIEKESLVDYKSTQEDEDFQRFLDSIPLYYAKDGSEWPTQELADIRNKLIDRGLAPLNSLKGRWKNEP